VKNEVKDADEVRNTDSRPSAQLPDPGETSIVPPVAATAVFQAVQEETVPTAPLSDTVEHRIDLRDKTERTLPTRR
jgi:hypothetical protein